MGKPHLLVIYHISHNTLSNPTQAATIIRGAVTASLKPSVSVSWQKMTQTFPRMLMRTDLKMVANLVGHYQAWKQPAVDTLFPHSADKERDGWLIAAEICSFPVYGLIQKAIQTRFFL